MVAKNSWTRRRLGVLAALTSALIGLTSLVAAPNAAAYEDECSRENFTIADNQPLPCKGPGQPYRWFDNDRDNSSTDLHLMNCTGNPNILLQRSSNGQNNWTNIGGWKRFWCLNSDGGWQNWGRQAGGFYYRFLVEDPRTSSGSITIGYIHAAW